MNILLEKILAVLTERKKREEKVESTVYRKDDCPFNYCDAPELCKELGECRYKPTEGEKAKKFDELMKKYNLELK